MTSLERDRVPSPRPIATREIPLVDRVEEMNALKEAVYRAVHGEGGLVFVHGEAGIGKTRLIRELGAYARSRGVQVLYGRCPALFRMDGVPPYILWKEVIKDYLGECTPEQLNRVIGFYPAEVAKLVPEISQKLKTIPQSFPINPEQEQNRLFEAVSQFIINISQETPLLVVLDDLQWTDPSSLLLLHYLTRGVQKTSLLLLGAYRSTDINDKHPLFSVLTELKRERLQQSISLKRMSMDETLEIIKQILEQDDVPPEFCQMIFEKTRGNPFFTEEVIESLKEEDVIYREENQWKFKEISKIEFPESVKNIVKARLSRLDDECQNVLTLASLIGNDFTLAAMSAVSGIEENKLLELMDKILKTGLIKERELRGEGVCSFADILVRDVVYEEVSLLKRKKLHGVVGDTLEKAYAKTIDEHYGELAYHFLEGGNKDKALNYFLKAGEKARKVYANAEETSYLQSALRLLEEREDSIQEKATILERLGELEKLAGKYDDCVKCWNEAMPLWVKLEKKDKVAVLHRKMANLLWDRIGDKKKAKEHQDAALRILENEQESVELARLYEDVAHMRRRMGELNVALPIAEKALAIAERLNDLEVIALSCAELAEESGLAFGDINKSFEYANRALKIALENEYWETALWAYCRMAAWAPLDEYEKRMDYIVKGLAIAEKIGHVVWQSVFRVSIASERMGCGGELEKVVSAMDEAFMMLRRIGDKSFYILNALQGLGEAYRRMGKWEESEEYLREASSMAGGQDEFGVIAGEREFSGRLQLDKEDYEKAKESFEEGLKVWERSGGKLGQMYYSTLLVRVLIELGELEKAQNMLDDFRSFALKTEKWAVVLEMTLRATLLRAQKKHDESIELFERALREWELLKANIWNAYNFAKYVLCEYARAYLERNQQSDKEEALNLLDQALEMFRKMGAKKDIEKVEARMAFIETGKVASKPRPTDHVSTGYAGLDKLLNGGVPSPCAVVLTSPSCSERDLLVNNFLGAGAKKGESTFFVTIDPVAGKRLAEEFQSNFYFFVCNPEADAIIKDSPSVFKMKGVESLTEISIVLTSAIRQLDPSLKSPRRICLDVVSDVLLRHHAVETRRWLTALLTKLKSEGFTTLAVVDPRIHPSEELCAILGLFEGEISIFEKETDKGSAKYLKIQKMSNQKYLKDELPLAEEE